VGKLFIVVGAAGGIASYIPGTLRYTGAGRQSECRANLKGLFTCEQAFFGDRRSYTARLAELDCFRPERGNRYAYFLGPVGSLEERGEAELRSHTDDVGIGVDTHRHHVPPRSFADLPSTFAGGRHLGIDGICPACTITMACVGQVGSGPLDVWSISSADRSAGASTIYKGEPFHEAGGPYGPEVGPWAILFAALLLIWALGSIALAVLAATSPSRREIYRRQLSTMTRAFVVVGWVLVLPRILSGH
jgi:type IV pilus assembly protein PilA